MHNVVYPEVLSDSQPDREIPFTDDTLANIFTDEEDFDGGNVPDLLTERMGGDYDLDQDEIDSEPRPSTSHLPDFQGPENTDLDGYHAIISQFDENPIDQLHLDDPHAIEDAEDLVMARLETLGYEKSPTQPNTPGDGNCWIHGILDQLR